MRLFCFLKCTAFKLTQHHNCHGTISTTDITTTTSSTTSIADEFFADGSPKCGDICCSSFPRLAYSERPCAKQGGVCYVLSPLLAVCAVCCHHCVRVNARCRDGDSRSWLLVNLGVMGAAAVFRGVVIAAAVCRGVVSRCSISWALRFVDL